MVIIFSYRAFQWDNEQILQMECDIWLFYKHGGGFELGTTVNKSSLRLGVDLNSGNAEYKSDPALKPLSHAAYLFISLG